MKFWIHVIDWRTRAVNVVDEATNENEARIRMATFLRDMCDTEKAEFHRHHTLSHVLVTPEMETAAEQFRRVNGLVA